MIRATTLSGTHQFMGQIANGYDRKLADRGEGLSGGQRQSIAIARALVGDPPVVLFDEPSSAMDNQTENALLDRLEEELAGRTFIVITHRTPFLRLVRRVIIVDRGKIIADGPRDAILQKLNRPKVAAI
jgi:ATP-binding cassette, subfamily C, bacterial LapB